MKTNLQLVDHAQMAKSQGWGYVYGTYGQVFSRTIFNAVISRYPGMYDADYIRRTAVWLTASPTGGPVRVADCSGLIKSCLMWTSNGPVYIKEYDVSANGLLFKATIKGPIGTIPETPGILVHKNGHVGIYIGGGKVIESKGADFGVVETVLTKELNPSKWLNWSRCPFIQYVEAPKPIVPVKPTDTVSLGDNGGDVMWVQQKLNVIMNAGLVADGNFGEKTLAAVKAFQTKYKLEVDGNVGPLTLAMLVNPVLPSSNPYEKPIFTVAIRMGAYGEAVRWIQYILKFKGYFSGVIGGNYGPITYEAVKAFQKAMGLEVDGVCGPITLAALAAVKT